MRVEPEQLNQLLRPGLRSAEDKKKAVGEGRVLAKGLPRRPRRGLRPGRLQRRRRRGLGQARRAGAPGPRLETSPEDIKGMDAAEGILTAQGGMTSHAALVARQMGKVCIVGCGALDIDYAQGPHRGQRHDRQGGRLALHRRHHRRGDPRPARDTPSEVAAGAARGPMKPEESPSYQLYAKLMSVGGRGAHDRACAPTPTSRTRPPTPSAFGAEGIGLCRTEHMFFGGDAHPGRARR